MGKNVTIEDLPSEVRAALLSEAEAAGESLESYLRRTLIERTGWQGQLPWPDFVDRFVAEVSALPPSDDGTDTSLLRGMREAAPRWIPDFDVFPADGSDERGA